MILFQINGAISNIAALLAHVFGAHCAIRNSFPGLALGMGGEKVEQEPFPLLSRWAGKPGEHQQWGGYHARPANQRKTEMSDTIETQNDDLFAPVSFGGGGKKRGGSKRRTKRGTVTSRKGGGDPYNTHSSNGPAGSPKPMPKPQPSTGGSSWGTDYLNCVVTVAPYVENDNKLSTAGGSCLIIGITGGW